MRRATLRIAAASQAWKKRLHVSVAPSPVDLIQVADPALRGKRRSTAAVQNAGADSGLSQLSRNVLKCTGALALLFYFGSHCTASMTAHRPATNYVARRWTPADSPRSSRGRSVSQPSPSPNIVARGGSQSFGTALREIRIAPRFPQTGNGNPFRTNQGLAAQRRLG